MQWLYWLFLGDSKNFHNCSNIIHHHIPFLLLRQRCCCIGHRLRSDIYLKNKGIIREQPRNRQLFCGFAPHCKSVVYDFGGSNPPPSTKAKRHSKRNVFFALAEGRWRIRKPALRNVPVARFNHRGFHRSESESTTGRIGRRVAVRPWAAIANPGRHAPNPKERTVVQ